MAIYKIGDMIIDFTPLFSDYFSTRIGKFSYEGHEEPNRYLTTSVGEIGDLPKEKPVFSHLSKVMFQSGNLNFLYIYSDANQSVLMQIITFDNDYKKVNIILSPKYSDKLPEVEYLTTGLMFFEMAIREGYYPFHGSAINYHNEAVIFSGPSGIGKSTHAALWKKYLTEISYVNDDKPLLFVKNNQVYVCGTPWSGKTSFTENITLKVKAIIFLSQSVIPKILPMTKAEMVVAFLKNGFRSREKDTQDLIIQDIESIIKSDTVITGFQTDISEQAFKIIFQFFYGGVI